MGRAKDLEPNIVPETIWESIDLREMLNYGFHTSTSCGMEHNLYVEPDGSANPCYAWHGEELHLGSINKNDGLNGIIRSKAFQDLGTHNVNTNQQCCECMLRYLCGGACRAWNR